MLIFKVKNSNKSNKIRELCDAAAIVNGINFKDTYPIAYDYNKQPYYVDSWLESEESEEAIRFANEF